jgi:hypothetical protein
LENYADGEHEQRRHAKRFCSHWTCHVRKPDWVQLFIFSSVFFYNLPLMFIDASSNKHKLSELSIRILSYAHMLNTNIICVLVLSMRIHYCYFVQIA